LTARRTALYYIYYTGKARVFLFLSDYIYDNGIPELNPEELKEGGDRSYTIIYL